MLVELNASKQNARYQMYEVLQSLFMLTFHVNFAFQASCSNNDNGVKLTIPVGVLGGPVCVYWGVLCMYWGGSCVGVLGDPVFLVFLGTFIHPNFPSSSYLRQSFI